MVAGGRDRPGREATFLASIYIPPCNRIQLGGNYIITPGSPGCQRPRPNPGAPPCRISRYGRLPAWRRGRALRSNPLRGISAPIPDAEERVSATSNKPGQACMDAAAGLVYAGINVG